MKLHRAFRYALLGFLIQLVGAVLAVLSQTAVLHLELVGELAVIVGFGILLCYGLSLLGVVPGQTAVSQ